MGKAQGGEVRVYRLGRAKDVEGGERVRWSYAVFIPEEALESYAGLFSGDELPPPAIEGLVAALGPGAIRGVDAVRRASQLDPQLRRALRDARQALRDARQALRKGSGEPPPK